MEVQAASKTMELVRGTEQLLALDPDDDVLAPSREDHVVQSPVSGFIDRFCSVTSKLVSVGRMPMITRAPSCSATSYAWLSERRSSLSIVEHVTGQTRGLTELDVELREFGLEAGRGQVLQQLRVDRRRVSELIGEIHLHLDAALPAPGLEPSAVDELRRATRFPRPSPGIGSGPRG